MKENLSNQYTFQLTKLYRIMWSNYNYVVSFEFLR